MKKYLTLLLLGSALTAQANTASDLGVASLLVTFQVSVYAFAQLSVDASVGSSKASSGGGEQNDPDQDAEHQIRGAAEQGAPITVVALEAPAATLPQPVREAITWAVVDVGADKPHLRVALHQQAAYAAGVQVGDTLRLESKPSGWLLHTTQAQTVAYLPTRNALQMLHHAELRTP